MSSALSCGSRPSSSLARAAASLRTPSARMTGRPQRNVLRADGEVLERALRLRAPVVLGRDAHLAHAVVLDAPALVHAGNTTPSAAKACPVRVRRFAVRAVGSMLGKTTGPRRAGVGRGPRMRALLRDRRRRPRQRRVGAVAARRDGVVAGAAGHPPAVRRPRGRSSCATPRESGTSGARNPYLVGVPLRRSGAAVGWRRLAVPPSR